jgi:hypothetical protein
MNLSQKYEFGCITLFKSVFNMSHNAQNMVKSEKSIINFIYKAWNESIISFNNKKKFKHPTIIPPKIKLSKWKQVNTIILLQFTDKPESLDPLFIAIYVPDYGNPRYFLFQHSLGCISIKSGEKVHNVAPVFSEWSSKWYRSLQTNIDIKNLSDFVLSVKKILNY